eukprot:12431457-Karenia_brevis.AAC.1
MAPHRFVTVIAPQEQPILMKEVEPHKDSQWRAGINLMPGDLETKIIKLVQKELDEVGMKLERVENGSMCLVATKHLHEGELICPLASLLFDSEAAVE